MIDRIAIAIIVALTLTALEQTILPKIGLGFLLEPGGTPPSSTTVMVEPPLPLAASFLPTGYGLVILVLSATYLWLFVVGLSIGKARTKYSELAEKDGEKDIVERYQLPNLYARKWN